MSLFDTDMNVDMNNNITVADPKVFLEKFKVQGAVLGYNLLWSSAILIVGIIFIWIFIKIFRCILNRKKLNKTLSNFIIKVIKTILYILLISICVDLLGFQVLSIATILGAGALAVGLALSGFLQNFVAGVYLIAQRPVDIGDYVSVVDSAEGEIIEIGVVSSIIRTPDRRQIIIPNSNLASNNIINYNKEEIRRCECKFTIPMEEDINFCRKIILRLCKNDPRVLHNPSPQLRTLSINSSVEGGATGILLSARAFVNREYFWELYFDLPELIKLEFERCGVKIQIPQTEVYMQEAKKYEHTELDEDYLKELEEAIIQEIKEPESENNSWTDYLHPCRLAELGGRIPIKNLWGLRWKQKAAKSNRNSTEMKIV